LFFAIGLSISAFFVTNYISNGTKMDLISRPVKNHADLYFLRDVGATSPSIGINTAEVRFERGVPVALYSKNDFGQRDGWSITLAEVFGSVLDEPTSLTPVGAAHYLNGDLNGMQFKWAVGDPLPQVCGTWKDGKPIDGWFEKGIDGQIAGNIEFFISDGATLVPYSNGQEVDSSKVPTISELIEQHDIRYDDQLSQVCTRYSVLIRMKICYATSSEDRHGEF